MANRIIGNTTATPNPRPDWNQTDETKADFIKNKPTIGALASKDEVAKTDLASDVQESLDKVDSAIQDISGKVDKVDGKGLSTNDFTDDYKSKVDTALQSFVEDDPTVPAYVKNITANDITNWNSKSTFDGDYNSLTNKPTKVSDFDNDKGYLTDYSETDPTVPDWAKADNKPSYDLDEVSDTSNYVRMTPDERAKLSGVSVGANKIEASTTNGNIKIDGVETNVYTHQEVDYSVTVSEDTTDSTIAKRYIFKQLNNEIGRIDLAKELVVKSGSVKEVAEAGKPYDGAVVGDKYIELVIANQTDPIYVPAKDLVDIYTAKTGSTDVQIVIDGNNEISAALVDGGIVEDKLDQSIKTKINKTWEEVGVAKSLVDALAGGQVNTNKAAIDAINNAETGILAVAKNYAKDAVDKMHTHDNESVLNNISSDNITNWTAAYNHSQADHAPSNAQANVQADWSVDDTASDAFINNKPTLGDLAAKSKVAKTDLEDDITTSLVKADTALQAQDITGYVTRTEFEAALGNYINAINELLGEGF